MNNTSFETSNQKVPLSQESASILFTTELQNPNVKSSLELTIDAKTIKNSDLSSTGAFLAIWKGTTAPISTNDFIGITNLSGISNGEFNNYTINVTAPDVSLITDNVTIGLFLKVGDINSFGANLSLLAGQQVHLQQTGVYAITLSNKQILIAYVVPDFIEPKERLDRVYLFKGDTPIMDDSKAITYIEVPTNANYGAILLDVSGYNLETGDYIVQYSFEYNNAQIVAAAYPFSLEYKN